MERLSGVMSVPSVPRLSVTSTGPGRRKLLEVSIDTPQDGGSSDAWAVRVRGHLLSETGLVPEIAAVVPGSVLAVATTGLPTPEVGGLHPARGHARSAAALRVSRARGAAGRIAGEGRRYRR